MLDLFVQLSQNDGVDTPEPLYITLTTKPRFAARMTELSSAVRDGKGLSHLSLVENHVDLYDSDKDEDAERVFPPEEYQSPYGEEDDDGLEGPTRDTEAGEGVVEAEFAPSAVDSAYEVITESLSVPDYNPPKEYREEHLQQTEEDIPEVNKQTTPDAETASPDHHPVLDDDNEDVEEDLLDYNEEDDEDEVNDSNWSSSTTIRGDDAERDESKQQVTNKGPEYHGFPEEKYRGCGLEAT